MSTLKQINTKQTMDYFERNGSGFSPSMVYIFLNESNNLPAPIPPLLSPAPFQKKKKKKKKKGTPPPTPPRQNGLFGDKLFWFKPYLEKNYSGFKSCRFVAKQRENKDITTVHTICPSVAVLFCCCFFFALPGYIFGVHHFWVRFLRM